MDFDQSNDFPLDEEEDEELEDGEEPQDEDEDEEEEDESVRKPKKRKKGVSRFIDDIADVEEDEDEEDDLDDEDDIGPVDDDFDEVAQSIDFSKHQQLDRGRRNQEDLSAEALAEDFQRRYARKDASNFTLSDSTVTSRMLMPSVNDPSLWLQGKERDMVIQLWRKYMEVEAKSKINIMSIFTRENLPGYIYIEAHDKRSVDMAIENVNGIFVQTVKVIPVDDMVACLRIKRKEIDLKEGSWVRVKKGKYGGDLAKVVDVIDSGSQVTVRIVPRLEISNDRKLDRPGEKRKKGSTAIPPQKLFNRDHYNKHLVQEKDGLYVFQNEWFDKKGYLLKEFKLTSLDTEKVNPTLEETTKFSGGVLNERDLDSITANFETFDFQVGDNIQVFKGDLKDLTGKVVSIDQEFVTVAPKDARVGNIRVEVKDIRKKFDEGDHVKVVYGNHTGETGLIAKIDGTIATILSDSTMNTIQVFIKDIRRANDSTTVSAEQSLYDVDDAVQITPQDAGIVIRVEKSNLTVINQFGNVIKLAPQQILRKLDQKNGRTTDGTGKTVSAGDAVHVMDVSKNTTKKAVVLHIYRSFVFLKSRESIENNGVFVARPNHVSLITGTGTAMQNNGGFARPLPVIQGGMGRGRRDPLINATVTIIGGAYKGYIGIVKDMTSGGARVELHTNSRIVTVNPNILKAHGANGRPTSSYSGSNYGSDGGRTPAYYGSGSKTPRRSNDGGITPNPYNDGSRTPGWDSGSRTPGRTEGWEMGSKTPARVHDDYSFQHSEPETPYNSATPHAYEPGTPFNVETPGFPHTPAGYPNHGSVHTIPYTPGNNPTTPFTPSFAPFTPFPSTPAAGVEPESYGTTTSNRSVSFDDWLTTDIEVIIRTHNGRGFKNGAFDSEKAVIRAVENPRLARVIISKGGAVESIPIENLEPTRPEKKGLLKVLAGRFKGELGELIGIDDSDGIVKLNNGIFEPIPFNQLAKFVAAV